MNFASFNEKIIFGPIKMKPHHSNLEKLTLRNKDYRRVVYTVPNYAQLVVMSIPSGEDIPLENHRHTTQFIRIEKGKGKAIIGGHVYSLKDGTDIMIPPNRFHQIVNTGTKPLKLYTIYNPPEHPVHLRQRVKLE